MQIRIVDSLKKYFNSDIKIAFLKVGQNKKNQNDTVVKINDIHLVSEEEEFIHTICSVYGFDEETARIMKTIYVSMEEKYGDKASQRFFALMASFSYGQVKGAKNGLLWGIIANILPVQAFGYDAFEIYGISEDEYKHLKVQIEMQHIVCEMGQGTLIEELELNAELKQYLNARSEKILGISWDELPEEVKQPIYESCLQYCYKPDFTHLCATAATILYDGDNKALGGLAGVFNGVYSADSNAGYVGDLYGTNGVEPNMTNDDYMADLDAVNIAGRVENGGDLLNVMSDYYEELENGTTNRAKEFKYNIGGGNEQHGLYILTSESVKYFNLLEERGLADDPKEFERRKELCTRFFNSIFNDYNYLSDE